MQNGGPVGVKGFGAQNRLKQNLLLPSHLTMPALTLDLNILLVLLKVASALVSRF